MILVGLGLLLTGINGICHFLLQQSLHLRVSCAVNTLQLIVE